MKYQLETRTNGQAAPQRRPPLIPPHIAWPGFVVLLLLGTVVTMVSVLYAANSDGGAAVVDDYYQQAIHWDEAQRARTASAALGWTAEAVVHPAESGGLVPVEVTVLDRAGAPVEGLTGTLRARRADAAKATATLPLAASEQPGVYRQLVPVPRGGVWDFEVEAARGDDRFLTTLRHEL